jgi:hypothetical protein
MKKNIPKYKVIKDTREQDGWFFSPYDKCSGMEVSTLHTGDYTMEGFEDVVCIERKASVSEIAMNLGKKKDAFYREIERMRDFHFRYLLLEFSASDILNYPMSLLSEDDKAIYEAYQSGECELPDFKRFKVVEQTKISGRYLLKALMEISIRYDVNVMFCDNKHNAFMICNSIFKRLNELFHKEE